MKAVNLLPAELRATTKVTVAKQAAPPPEGSAVGAFALLGALAACVLALAVYVLATNTVKAREVELADVSARQEAAAARAAKLKPYADFEQLASARVATVKQLAESRFDWEQALRDISRALPAEVTLKSLNGTVSNGSTGAPGAGGGSSLRSAVAAPAIELKGCTRSQPAVAELMSRLRTVDGVTRVSLAKSDKDDTQGGANAAPAPVAPGTMGSAGTTQYSECGAGSPPAFELIIFFERAAGASVAPTPGAAAPPAAGAAGAPAGQAAPASGTGAAPASGSGSGPAEASNTPASTGTNRGGS